MPMIEPAKVATSPNATRTVSWMTPCGAISIPTNSRMSPPRESVAAVTSCSIRSFIGVFVNGRKYATKGEDVFDFWGKGSIKNGDDQKIVSAT